MSISSGWVAVCVGLALQALLGFFFLGKMKQKSDGMDGQITILLNEMKTFRSEIGGLIGDGKALAWRMSEIERDAAWIKSAHDTMVGFRAATEVEHRNFREGIERINRSLDGVNRSLSQLTTRGRAKGIIPVDGHAE